MKTIIKLLCIPCILCLMSFYYNWHNDDYEYTNVLDNFQDSYVICTVICSIESTSNEADYIERIISDCVKEIQKQYDMTVWNSDQGYIAKGHLESIIEEKVKKQFPNIKFEIKRTICSFIFI